MPNGWRSPASSPGAPGGSDGAQVLLEAGHVHGDGPLQHREHLLDVGALSVRVAA
jgi:hypothetical protein